LEIVDIRVPYFVHLTIISISERFTGVDYLFYEFFYYFFSTSNYLGKLTGKKFYFFCVFIADN